MKALKKSMLILSVMTVIGGLGFSATAKNTRKRVVKKPVVKKVVTESYTCGADTIKVSYPTTKTARVVDGSGKVYNLFSFKLYIISVTFIIYLALQIQLLSINHYSTFL